MTGTSRFFAIVVWFFYTLKYSPVSLGIFNTFLVIAFVVEGLMQRVAGLKDSVPTSVIGRMHPVA